MRACVYVCVCYTWQCVSGRRTTVCVLCSQIILQKSATVLLRGVWLTMNSLLWWCPCGDTSGINIPANVSLTCLKGPSVKWWQMQSFAVVSPWRRRRWCILWSLCPTRSDTLLIFPLYKNTETWLSIIAPENSKIIHEPLIHLHRTDQLTNQNKGHIVVQMTWRWHHVSFLNRMQIKWL